MSAGNFIKVNRLSVTKSDSAFSSTEHSRIIEAWISLSHVVSIYQSYSDGLIHRERPHLVIFNVDKDPDVTYFLDFETAEKATNYFNVSLSRNAF